MPLLSAGRIKKEYVRGSSTQADARQCRINERQVQENDNKVNHPDTQVTFNEHGGVGNLGQQPKILNEALSAAMKGLRRHLFLSKTGIVIPLKVKADLADDFDKSDAEGVERVNTHELSGGLITARTVLKSVLKSDVKYNPILECCDAQPAYLKLLCVAVWERRSSQRHSLVMIGCDIVDKYDAFKLKKLFLKDKPTKNNTIRLQNAVLALLEKQVFVHTGKLVRKGNHDEDVKVEFLISPLCQKFPYSSPYISEYVARGLMGLVKEKGSLKFQPPQFPVEDTPEDPKHPQKLVPRSMVAFAATMLKVAIRSYVNGKYSPGAINEDELGPIYKSHDNKISELKPGSQEGIFIRIFQEASTWLPPVVAPEYGTTEAMQESKEDTLAYFAQRARASSTGT
ncbi:unnamed protein product [Peniophora sp. CBMAI 1063]|nr:unnamed protein product [Peniophora sp. CBMAI 1063]